MMKTLNQKQKATKASGKPAVILLLAAVLWMSGATDAFSQQVSYKVTKDDPEDALVDLYIGLNPLWMELGGQNLFSAGWGAYAFYNLDQTLMFEADLRMPYTKRWLDGTYYELDEKGKKTKDDFFNDYKPTKLTMLNVAGSWTFASKTRANRPMKAVVSQSTSGNVTTTKSLAFRGTKKRLYQLHGGVFYNKTTQTEGVPTPDGWAEFTQNTQGQATNPYTNMQYTALFGGIQLSRVWEAQVDISEYGTRTTRAHNSWYFDIMYAPVIRVRQLKAGDQTYNLIQEGDFARKNLGWRMCWAARPDYKNFLWGLEFGDRPHIQAIDDNGDRVEDFSRGAFFNFWMVFSIYNKY